MSVYFHHSGYADQHVEIVYNSIDKMTKSRKNMQVVGGETSTLNLVPELELNAPVLECIPSTNQTAEVTGWSSGSCNRNLWHSTRCTKKTPEKQFTYRTPNGAEKQLDYTLVNKKYLRCSEDAEANDMIHMGSDHRCVMAQFVIPAPKKEDSQNRFKKMDELFHGEHQKPDE